MSDEFPSHPWTSLQTVEDVDAWMDRYNRELQQATEARRLGTHGICFELEQGGEIYLHTTQEGDALLDVTPEAEWISPVITAATRIEASASRLWILPGHVLTQLIFGLNPLIGSSRIVLDHPFKLTKWRSPG